MYPLEIFEAQFKLSIRSVPGSPNEIRVRPVAAASASSMETLFGKESNMYRASNLIARLFDYKNNGSV